MPSTVQRVQAGCQVTIGIALVSLFVFVRELAFPNICLAATLFIVSGVLLSPDSNMGTKLMGACLLLGPSWLATVMAAAVISLAMLVADPKQDAATFLFITSGLSILGLVPISITRLGRNTPYMAPLGMVLSNAYGVTLIFGFISPSLWSFWSRDVYYLMGVTVLAFGATTVTGMLVLPTTAADEAAECLVEVMRRAGMVASRNTKVLSEGEKGTAQGSGDISPTPASPSLSPGSSSQPSGSNVVPPDVDDGEPSEDVFLEVLRQATQPLPARPRKDKKKTKKKKEKSPTGDQEDPHGSRQSPASGTQSPIPQKAPNMWEIKMPVAALGPIISRARVCLGNARLEPPCLTGRGRLRYEAWVHLCDTLGTLTTRLAAVEGVLESPLQVMSLPANLVVVRSLRDILAQVAASCVALTDTLGRSRLEGAGKVVRSYAARVKEHDPIDPLVCCTHMYMYGRSWDTSRNMLREKIREWVGAYWGNVKSQEPDKPRISQATTVRQLMFLWCLTTGLTVAMEDVEKAVMDLLADDPSPDDHQGSTDGARVVDESSAVVEIRPMLGAASQRRRLLPRIASQLSFMPQMCYVLLCLPVFAGWWSCLVLDMPRVFRPGGFKELMRSRQFQAGVKVWLSLSLTLVLILTLMTLVPDARKALPIFGYVAATLCMSEKAEATFSKVTVMVVGTVLGGTLGYGLMAGPDLANSPYGLLVVFSVVTFLVGYLGVGSQYRTAITLALMTLSAIILCQYRGCCGATGTLRFYLNRVLAVILGCLTSVLISNLMLPWYTSTWAMDTMASALEEATEMVAASYQAFYDEAQAAAAASQLALSSSKQSDTTSSRSRSGLSSYLSIDIPGGTPRVPQGRSHSGMSSSYYSFKGPEGPIGLLSGSPFQALGIPEGILTVQWLQSKVAQPLVAVQVALNKDTALWKKGVLATPPIVHQALRGMLEVLDRLAAVQLTLMAPPVSGHFSGWSFTRFITPLHEDMSLVTEELRGLTAATVRHLRYNKEDHGQIAAAVQDHIHRLEVARLALRRHTITLRKQYYLEMIRLNSAHRFMHHTHPDDAVRFLSYLYAFVKYLDTVTSMARIVLSSKDNIRCGWNSWMVW